eukprot:10480832-Ditylum_brightwellii.AAC.1
MTKGVPWASSRAVTYPDSPVFLVIRLSKYGLERRRPGKQERGVTCVQVGQSMVIGDHDADLHAPMTS